ncbi:MAG: DUF4956 domain-containing protein [Candidatus Magasanikbacteria bacterium CG10_big_fil_rev_8_21_14_0_10_43_6]|uniref:DUF4956 domain-containing protein n=1 Tax=Candidatus Magasanikbacteria bacterium CG10_big_fil_rev_8_21_14_0_10_43_6 TaxID=1974650 RepID=A0A2M6W1P8_9BACT|nr:MAG: DUF4956 domain-containing protein [Candidatus Magasanikbacteria bacterium CG10_big_fil_rev_8_21_14_0_10_43_6]
MNLDTFTAKDLFGNQQFISAVNFTVGQIIMSLLLTFVLSAFIYYIYKKTYSGVTFSKHFGMTLILVALVAAVIVMAISGNLALSLGMIGALSIVRFRSAIKDPRDIAFLFWAVSTGIVAGVFIYKLAIISHLLIAGVILFFSRKQQEHRVFLLVISGKDIDKKKLEEVLTQTCKKTNLRLETVIQGQEQLHIEVTLKKSEAMFGASDLNKKISSDVPGIEKITAVSEEDTLSTV